MQESIRRSPDSQQRVDNFSVLPFSNLNPIQGAFFFRAFTPTFKIPRVYHYNPLAPNLNNNPWVASEVPYALFQDPQDNLLTGFSQALRATSQVFPHLSQKWIGVPTSKDWVYEKPFKDQVKARTSRRSYSKTADFQDLFATGAQRNFRRTGYQSFEQAYPNFRRASTRRRARNPYTMPYGRRHYKKRKRYRRRGTGKSRLLRYTLTRGNYAPFRLSGTGWRSFRPGPKGRSMISRTSRARMPGIGVFGRTSVLYPTEVLCRAQNIEAMAPNLWAAEDVCGHFKYIAKVAVKMQPFCHVDAGCRHSIQMKSNGANWNGLMAIHSLMDHPDLVKRMEQYSSVRVKGVRVELYVNPYASNINGLGGPLNQLDTYRIHSAYDKYDTTGDAVITGGQSVSTQKSVSLDVMRRLPYYKSFDVIGGASTDITAGKVQRAHVLLNIVFPPPGKTSRTIVTDATDAVLPGEWDSRSIHTGTYANAYTLLQNPTIRAGALLIYMSRITGTADGARQDIWRTTSQPTQGYYPFRIKTWFDLEFKDPLESTGHLDP